MIDREELLDHLDLAGYHIGLGEFDVAQVYATLYLAEQTRLNNLLEILGNRDVLVDEESDWAQGRVKAQIEQRNAIRAQIREGLGL